jgi:excisionase family DNA binding protein
MFKRKEDDKVLHVPEVAKLLNCATITVYRLVQRKSGLANPIPGHRVGRRWIFYHDEVVKWVKSL